MRATKWSRRFALALFCFAPVLATYYGRAHNWSGPAIFGVDSVIALGAITLYTMASTTERSR